MSTEILHDPRVEPVPPAGDGQPGDLRAGAPEASEAAGPADPSAIPPAGQAAAPCTAGAMLAQARERCGLSLGEVANHLKLSLRQVEAIEADAFGRLPSPMFVRGFARSYARLVQLDPVQVMAALDAQLPAQPSLVVSGPGAQGGSSPVLQAAIPFPSPDQPSRRTHSLAALLAAVVVGFLAFEWFGPVSVPGTVPVSQGVPQATQDAAVLQPAVQAGAPTADPATADPSAAAVPDAAAPAPAAGSGSDAQPAGGPGTSPDLGQAFGPGPRTVRLSFDRESWVEIRDARGRLIFSQLNPPGSSQVVQGEPPLSLVVGNARSVRLAYGDRDIDLAPHTRVDVARLKLD